VQDLGHLSTQSGAGVDQNRVELDVEALQRAVQPGHATADDDDVVMLFAGHPGQRTGHARQARYSTGRFAE